MNKSQARSELQRLIDEAPAVAPSIARKEGHSYGKVTDEGFNAQKAQRWEVEATSLLQGLASSGGQPFALLNGQYHEEKGRAAGYHSKSIFIDKAMQFLTTAVELLDSATSEIVLPHAQQLAAVRFELDVPEVVTIHWLLKHVPVPLWLAAGGLLVAAFAAGVTIASIPFVQGILGTAPPP